MIEECQKFTQGQLEVYLDKPFTKAIMYFLPPIHISPVKSIWSNSNGVEVKRC